MASASAPASSSSSPATVPGKIFIGGISPNTDEAALAEHFGRYGKVEKVVVVRNRSTGISRGFGFVTFAADSADAADSTDAAVSATDEREKDRHIISGKQVDVKLAIPKEHLNGGEPIPEEHLNGGEPSRRNSYRGQNSNGKKIFIGGLPRQITNDELRAYFEQFGVVTDSVVMHKHDDTGRATTPRGFGFVTFASEESAREVMKDRFHELNGKRIEIKIAVPKTAGNPNPNPSPMHGSTDANSVVSCDSVRRMPSVCNSNVHPYVPHYPVNNTANPYSQVYMPAHYSPYVGCNNVYYYPQPYAYSFSYAWPYAADSAWYYGGWMEQMRGNGAPRPSR